jgi:hypothetical protein
MVSEGVKENRFREKELFGISGRVDVRLVNFNQSDLPGFQTNN